MSRSRFRATAQTTTGLKSSAATNCNSKTAPDFENPTDANSDNVYEVNAVADDGNGLTTSQAILVTITPVNEEAPVFTSPPTANVVENILSVHTLTATDVDVPFQNVTFSISGNGADNDKFEIVSGDQLRFKTAPDFENPADANSDNVFDVSVLADDGIGLTTSQTIRVTVTNVNEQAPVFTSPSTAKHR